jgi:hypothetical protein
MADNRVAARILLMNVLGLYKHLRVEAAVSWLIWWTLLIGIATFGELADWASHLLVAIALEGTAGLCLAILMSSRVRVMTIRPASDVSFIRRELWFVVSMTGAMGAMPILGLLMLHDGRP